MVRKLDQQPTDMTYVNVSVHCSVSGCDHLCLLFTEVRPALRSSYYEVVRELKWCFTLMEFIATPLTFGNTGCEELGCKWMR